MTRTKTIKTKQIIYLIAGLMLVINPVLFGQVNSNVKVITKKMFSNKLDSLKKEFGNNKTFIPKLELQALIALSYYPSLNNTKIIFKRKKLKSTMAAKPKNSSVFRRRGKRTYFIHLNDYEESVNIPFDSTTFNAQIGVIGHELAHILYYEQTKSLVLIGLAFKYVNKKFRINFEKDTDKRAVNNGVGWQLYEWKKFIEDYPHAPAEYKAYKKKTYLSSNEIKELTINYFK